MDADSLRSALESEIAKIRMIDSHCHIIPFADLAGRMDVFKLFAYYNAYTLLASGMSVEEHQRLESDGVALEAKAEIFWPCWRRIPNPPARRSLLAWIPSFAAAERISVLLPPLKPHPRK